MTPAESVERTLLEDWRVRRDRLAERPEPPGRLGRVHLQIFDYLIRRYGDAPEAQRPARFSPRTGLYVNERAIVVHHHLYQRDVPDVKDAKDAEARAAAFLSRIVTAEGADEGKSTPNVEDELREQTVAEDIRFGSPQHRGTPTRTAELFYQYAADPARVDELAADLLAGAAHGAALGYLVSAWRERLRAGRRDKATRRLRNHILGAGKAQQVSDGIRNALADSHALVRLGALEILGQIGILEDVGLLSDLLALPPQDDEHAKERESLAWAMRQIAERGQTQQV
jgi:hypothetical protein